MLVDFPLIAKLETVCLDVVQSGLGLVNVQNALCRVEEEIQILQYQLVHVLHSSHLTGKVCNGACDVHNLVSQRVDVDLVLINGRSQIRDLIFQSSVHDARDFGKVGAKFFNRLVGKIARGLLNMCRNNRWNNYWWDDYWWNNYGWMINWW